MKDTDRNKGAERVAREAGLDQAERLDLLRELFPEAFAEGKVDWDKMRTTLGEEVSDSPERYSFSWAGKRDAIRLLQMPSRATLVPAPAESVDWDTTKNAFIEGDNLEVLKLLLKSYYGRVKMIYIDPPYNTGNDFVYPDNYADPLDNYLKLSGQKDAEGNLLTSNADSSGRFHSAWLSMMYPRLFLARQLLRDDGVIFISIDDNEAGNLRLMLNEIFGEENFIDCLIWKKRYGGGAKEKHLVSLHEYIFFYAKNKDAVGPIFVPTEEQSIKRYYTQQDDAYQTRGPYRTHPLEATKSMGSRPNLVYGIPAPDGTEVLPKRQWLWSKERTMQALKDGELEFLKAKDGSWSVHTKQYLKDKDGEMRMAKAFSIIDSVYTQHGTNEIIDLFGDAQVFSFPKPTGLIKPLLSLGTDPRGEDEIVMDFFAGAATTADAVLQMNNDDGGSRRFLLVQLPEPTAQDSAAYKKGFKNLAEIGAERVRLVSQRLRKDKQGKLKLSGANDAKDFGFRFYRLGESNYKPWTGVENADADQYATQLEAFADPLVAGWKPTNVINEVAIKEGFGLSLSIVKLEDVSSNEVFLVSDPDNGQSFTITLDAKLDPQTPKALELGKDDLFICRDSALTDEQAANLALQCRLKTV
jgi:adenine-specific DNA-methyltransferase